MRLEQRRAREPGLRRQILHNHRTAGGERIAGLRVAGGGNVGGADQPGLPSDTGSEQELGVARNQFEDFHHFEVENLPDRRDHFVEEFLQIAFGEARSPSRASVSCWRARTRTSRLTRSRSVTSRHMPRSCTAAPSCVMTVTEASNQRSSRSDGPGRRYSTRHGSSVCKVLSIAASTPVASCDFRSSAAIENVPSSVSSRRPWKSSSLVDQAN